MKKNIRAVMIIAAIALVAGVNMFNSKRVAMSDIALANIEALADEEWSDGRCFWVDWQYTLCTSYGLVPYHCPCGAMGR